MSIAKEVLKKYCIGTNDIFVETGTSLGDTVQTALDIGFKDIHSIEFYPNKYEHAKKRFADKTNVNLYLGDSGDELQNVLFRQVGRHGANCVIFLDSHFSCDDWTPIPEVDTCPILREIDIIGKWINDGDIDTYMKSVTVLIDDVRIFNKVIQSWHSLTLNNVIGQIKTSFGNKISFIDYDDGVEKNDILVVKLIL